MGEYDPLCLCGHLRSQHSKKSSDSVWHACSESITRGRWCKCPRFRMAIAQIRDEDDAIAAASRLRRRLDSA